MSALEPGTVTIEIAAAGVNRADLLQAAGKYPPPPGESDVLGLECTGRVVASADPRWNPGDEVCAILGSGGYGTHVTVDGRVLLRIPSGLSLIEAAALPEVVATVWSNLFMLAQLRPGERLLIHGGASGIGTMAIQLAKNIGARVSVTARASKHAALVELGADEVIDYTNDDFVSHGPFNVILDHMGGAYFERNLNALETLGRLVIIGTLGGSKAELDIAQLMRKRAAVLGTTLRARPLEEKRAILASIEEHVWPLVAAKKVKPIIDRIMPMDQWRVAHDVLERSEHIGKVILVNEQFGASTT